VTDAQLPGERRYGVPPRPGEVPGLDVFTCPACGSTSRSPADIADGYCGSCHAVTGARPYALGVGLSPTELYDVVPVATPTCPRCGSAPQLALSAIQAFCGNDACTVLMWNPSVSPAQNEALLIDVELEATDAELAARRELVDDERREQHHDDAGDD
jgi:hypothetical protein